MNILRIVDDNDPVSPRDEDCNFGTIYYSSSRYVLGDKNVSKDQIEELMNDRNIVHLKVYAYIHGGIALSTGAFSCLFDSGMSGIIAISKDKIRETYGVTRISKKVMEMVIAGLKAEVETYSKYLNGECYGYEIVDESDEVVDSCYGFFDREDCESEGNSALRFFNQKAA